MGAVRALKRAAPAEFGGPFLGIRSSARGLMWRERLPRDAQGLATAISQQHGIPELLGRVLAARGVTLDGVPLFLDPTIKALIARSHRRSRTWTRLRPASPMQS